VAAQEVGDLALAHEGALLQLRLDGTAVDRNGEADEVRALGLRRLEGREAERRPSIGGSGKAIRTVRGSFTWLRNT